MIFALVLMVNLLPVHALDQVSHKFTNVQADDHQGTNSNTAGTSITHHEEPHYPNGTSRTVVINNNQMYKYSYTKNSNETIFLKRKKIRPDIKKV